MTNKTSRHRASTILLAVLAPIAVLLLALFPLLSLFTQNQSEVELSVLVWPLLVCVVSTLAVYLLLLLITKRTLEAAILTSLAVLAVWYYGVFSDKLAGSLGKGSFTALWLALFGVLAFLVVRKGRRLENVLFIVAAGAAALAVPQIVSVVSYHVSHEAPAPGAARWWPTALRPPTPASVAQRPDIYVVIPDDYARPDVLQRYFHYSDASFLRKLAQRGFILSPRARSPYSDSESNTAAELNLDYLTAFPKVLGSKSQDVRPVKRAAQDNRAVRLLRPLGYRYVHIDTDEVTFGGSNPAISPLAPPDSFANLWLRKSILQLVGGPIGFSQHCDERPLPQQHPIRLRQARSRGEGARTEVRRLPYPAAA